MEESGEELIRIKECYVQLSEESRSLEEKLKEQFEKEKQVLLSEASLYMSGAPNGNFRENICSGDDLRSRIFGAFVVKFLGCLPLLGFSNIYKMV